MLDSPILLRPTEAAKSLGVCRAKLYTLIHDGEIPHVRLGGSIRVPTEQLRAVIAQRTLNADATTPVGGLENE